MTPRPQRRVGEDSSVAVFWGFVAAIALVVAIAVTCSMPADAAPWLSRAYRDLGTNPTGWSYKWCGRWMNMVTPGNWSNKCTANLNKGRPSTCRPGAVAIMASHCGLIGRRGCSGGRCEVISGNHSGRSGNRKVGMGSYPRSRIIACRWPH